MGLTAKFVIHVPLKNETEALDVTNRSMNDEYEDLEILGLAAEDKMVSDIILKEIVDNQNGIPVYLYKSRVKELHLVPTERKVLKMNDILNIEGEPHIIVKMPDDSINVYSRRKQKFYFQNNLLSIQEITSYFNENNIKYNINVI